ncbi:DsbE family thiol:disulfide interchange protein [Ehrlichia ruminantium]|uniref:DsbE family thiol:disulfide interchange protein n=1 Tax=Ehrlichia ruminantium TaxID=779 RepID=A0AAE6QBE0_EHRRU|nr:DsbE family thiol:disulfide interchange protein [Ehrlichia ruminantium]QGR02748.1 DsbE family thiol:disulfide interchange protein [Ehrlichia ruminantium]QGR03668.1 DsbE family thiol:disulfide interchange protein [Ehrlichia ruminantium]QGR04595.1 DsbE family thiol:disulfide interchange protein [Ehrlichia ruminantium]
MKIIGIIFLACFLMFVAIFTKALLNKNTIHDISNRIILPLLYTEDQLFDTNDLIGHPYILNVFASWCTTCQEEHSMLLDIAKEQIIEIYGINYLDTEYKVKEWLKTNGDPYTKIAKDYSGKVNNILGVTGVPETFIFDQHGKLLLHIYGSLTKDIWRTQILPLIQKTENSMKL